ncbi:hypothetical protein [Lutibacter citreus]|uniref:hypothetical protein n=1 Tax=Lutibacter citreus TaxID=2138210 RepID=UPI000DBE8F77|nr:hypothetical protein [Lutibacter citreus]
MPFKVCTTCSGTGQIGNAFSSEITYSICYKCGGSGQIMYSEPIPKTQQRNKRQTRGTHQVKQSPNTTKSENKGLHTILVIGGGLIGYFLSIMYITKSLIIAGIIGIITALIIYKWGQKLLIIVTIAGFIYFFFIKDK